MNCPAPKRGRPKSARKREQILEASSVMFLDQGYQATSMDAVAKQAGVSKQTLYSHFENKEQLFRACIQSKVQEYGLDLSEVNPTDPVEDTLAYFASHLLDLFHDPKVRSMYRVLLAEAPNHPQLCRTFYEAGPLATKTALANYLQSQSETGDLSITDPMDAAEWFVSSIETSFLTKLLLGIQDKMSNAERIKYINSRVRSFKKLLS